MDNNSDQIGMGLRNRLKISSPDGLNNKTAVEVWQEFHPFINGGNWASNITAVRDFTNQSLKICCCPTIIVDVEN